MQSAPLAVPEAALLLIVNIRTHFRERVRIAIVALGVVAMFLFVKQGSSPGSWACGVSLPRITLIKALFPEGSSRTNDSIS